MPHYEVRHRSKDTIFGAVRLAKLVFLYIPTKMGQNKNRVVVYIDGFNLYFGMMDAGFNHCKWLNIEKLVRGYLTAILISGDSDLVPPIKAVHQNFPNKVVSVFFPPNRHNNTVAGAARGSQIIGRKKLLDSQFEEKIQKKDGFILHKPSEWKP